MKKCYKCGKEIPVESSFCPYCMEKFVHGDNSGNIQSIKKSKKTYWVLGLMVLIVLMIIVIILVTGKGDDEANKGDERESSNIEGNIDKNFDDEADNTDGDSKNDNDSVEADKADEILDFETFKGIWYTDECVNRETTPIENGGCELKIYSIDEESILFSIYSYQTPPASRVAQVEYVEASLGKDGAVEFEFEDDGWGNAGKGKLTLEADSINVSVEVTDAGESAMWSLNVNANMLKSDEELKDESKDFMGVIGRDYYDVINVMGLNETGSENNEAGGRYHYLENGITIWEEDSMIYSVVVDYTEFNDYKKENYCFSEGINGNSSYGDIESAMGEIMFTDDYNGENVTCFKTKETLFPTYLKVTMVDGEIKYIHYYVSMT